MTKRQPTQPEPEELESEEIGKSEQESEPSADQDEAGQPAQQI